VDHLADKELDKQIKRRNIHRDLKNSMEQVTYLYKESAYRRIEQNGESLVKGNIPLWTDEWIKIMNKIV
jgi:hypothetical protein